MKKGSKIVLAVTVLLLVATCVHKETNRTQIKARKEGRHVPHGPYEAVLKRLFDILITGMALLTLAPVMGVTALLVKVKLGSPVIFKQERPGKDEKIFTLYKFRTMTNDTDENGKLLPDEKRLTRFGKWLRSTSLDELPELVNIFSGQMSLVGPRPLLIRYIPYYNETERRRHEVRPGLTGLAQVRGRNNLDWTERFRFDVEYVENVSFLLDIKIIMETIKKVVSHDGILVDTSKGELNFAVERKAGRI